MGALVNPELTTESSQSRVDNMNALTTAQSTRQARLDVLIGTASTVADADDYGDMLGALRLVEIAADQARRAVVAEARAAGVTWQTIADALGTSRQNAQQRFSD